MSNQEMLERKAKELGVKYLQRTLREVDQIRKLIAGLGDGNSAAALAEINSITHRIHGAGAVFGVDEVGDAAATIENLALADAVPIAITPALIAQFETLLAALETQVRNAMSQRGIGSAA